MSRPKIMITNVDRSGKVTEGWHVRIGSRWRTFSQAAWVKGGVEYVNQQLGKFK